MRLLRHAVCDPCRAPKHCSRYAFDVVREVLAGRRVDGASLAEAKLLRILLGEGDIEICPYCRTEATRFRDFGDRLMCWSCGRSFAG